MHPFIFRIPASTCMNNQVLVNLCGSVILHIISISIVLGPSITWAGSFDGSKFRVYIIFNDIYFVFS